MICEIVKDTFFLQQKSLPALPSDKKIAIDLLDTLKAHERECIGMAANMIGIRKEIIVVSIGKINVAMLNPRILHKKDPYETEEGCLCLSGTRKTVRYKTIDLEYEDLNFKKHRQTFTGITAEIIQHECDHLGGVLI